MKQCKNLIISKTVSLTRKKEENMIRFYHSNNNSSALKVDRIITEDNKIINKPMDKIIRTFNQVQMNKIKMVEIIKGMHHSILRHHNKRSLKRKNN